MPARWLDGALLWLANENFHMNGSWVVGGGGAGEGGKVRDVPYEYDIAGGGGGWAAPGGYNQAGREEELV